MNDAQRDTPLLLMTPGPTRVPQLVLDAGARPMIHHRTPAFSRALVQVIEGLRQMFGTGAGDVLPIHTTGRGAMEAAVTNLFSPGDEMVACCNGQFGEIGVLRHRLGMVPTRTASR